MSKLLLTGFDIRSLAGLSGAGFSVRYAADSQFTAETGELYLAGNSQENYRTIDLTEDGGVWSTDSHEFDTTTDSSDPNATYSAWVVNSRGREVYTLFERWAVPASMPTPATYLMLEVHNVDRVPLRDDEVYTKTQTELLIADAVEAAGPATTTTLGSVKTRTAPTDPASPTAVLDNDPLLPTQAENDALQGTAGSPSNSNRYVTDSDTRLVASLTFAALSALAGVVTGALRYVTDGTRGLYRKAVTSGLWIKLVGHTNLMDFGASGSGQQTTGSMSAVTNPTQLTLLGALDFKNGQGIYVAGAGAAGAPLVTSIVSGEGTTTLTLASPALTTVSGVLVQHDDSAALQAAYTAVGAAGGGNIHAPAAYFRCNGPLDATHAGIVVIPQNATGNSLITYGLLGEFVERTGGPAQQGRGTVFDISHRAAIATALAYPAFISAKARASTHLMDFSAVYPVVKDIHIITAVGGGGIGGLQFHNCPGMRLENVQFTTTEAASTSMTEPTNVYSIAVNGCGVNNYAQVVIENCSVLGWHNGYIASEHFHFLGPYASFVKRAFEFEAGGHVNWGKIGTEHSTYMIYRVGGGDVLLDLTLTGESDRTSGAWTQSTYEIEDPSNNTYGTVRCEITQPAAAAYVSARRNGAINLITTNIRTGRYEGSFGIGGLSSYHLTNGSVFGIHDGNTAGAVVLQGVPGAGPRFDGHLAVNAIYGDAAWARFDTASPSWKFSLSTVSDAFELSRVAAGANPISPWTNIIAGSGSGVTITPATTLTGGVTVGAGDAIARVKHGTATLTAGTVTVPMASVTANSRIFVHRQTDGGTVGASYSITRSVGVSFTITSKDGAGATQTSDTSTVAYLIVAPV